MKEITVDNIEYNNNSFTLNLMAHTNCDTLIVPSNLIDGDITESIKQYSVYDLEKKIYLVRFWLCKDGTFKHPTKFWKGNKFKFNRVTERFSNHLIASRV